MELTYKWIALAQRQYQLYLNRQLADLGLSGSQYLFLIHVCRRPGLVQDQLPGLVCLNKSNVTRSLAQLERRGYIRREIHPRDRRTALVFPTPAALAAYPRIMEVITGWDASVTGPLSMAEKAGLQELLKRVVEVARERNAVQDES